MQPMEEGLDEVCLIDTIVEEQAEQQQQHDVLIEELSKFFEELQETQEMCDVHGPWRKKMKKSFLSLPRKTREKKESMSPKILTSSLSMWN